MPVYEYTCTVCHHHFSVLQRMGESNEHLRCEHCGTPKPIKQFSTFASGSRNAHTNLASGGTPSRGFT